MTSGSSGGPSTGNLDAQNDAQDTPDVPSTSGVRKKAPKKKAPAAKKPKAQKYTGRYVVIIFLFVLLPDIFYRSLCFSDWRDANPHTDKKEFTKYWKALPEDQKEVFQTLPLSFILSDASNSIRYIIYARQNSCVIVSSASDCDIHRPRLLDIKIVLDIVCGYRGSGGRSDRQERIGMVYPRGGEHSIEDNGYEWMCTVLP